MKDVGMSIKYRWTYLQNGQTPDPAFGGKENPAPCIASFAASVDKGATPPRACLY